MRVKKRNEELFTFKTNLKEGEISGSLNLDLTKEGHITKRKGYNTFGEMVHVLWDINKRAKKMGFSSDYTIRLPLRGTKPVYKKTLKK